MRLDKYLKVSRLIKRRTVANDACDNERVMVNGRVQRASYDVKPVSYTHLDVYKRQDMLVQSVNDGPLTLIVDTDQLSS